MFTPPAAIEALLFAAGEPLEKKRLAALLDLKDKEFSRALQALVDSLNGHGLALIETATEVELRTAPSVTALVKKFHENELARDLGKAGLETLAVVAYHDGATRSEIDWVRGVNSSTSLRTLCMRGLIEGKEDERDKRRIRYTLTAEALAHLGLTRIEDLPRAAELKVAAHTVIEEESASEFV